MPIVAERVTIQMRGGRGRHDAVTIALEEIDGRPRALRLWHRPRFSGWKGWSHTGIGWSSRGTITQASQCLGCIPLDPRCGLQHHAFAHDHLLLTDPSRPEHLPHRGGVFCIQLVLVLVAARRVGGETEAAEVTPQAAARTVRLKDAVQRKPQWQIGQRQSWPRNRLHLRESDQSMYHLLLRRRPCGQGAIDLRALFARRSHCTEHHLTPRELLFELAKQAGLVDGFAARAVGERLQLLRNQTPRTIDLLPEPWHPPHPSSIVVRRERACCGLQLLHQGLVDALVLALKQLLGTTRLRGRSKQVLHHPNHLPRWGGMGAAGPEGAPGSDLGEVRGQAGVVAAG
eukprot:scaffold42364_cov69-Phaeocystis_antarctica.AAC.1